MKAVLETFLFPAFRLWTSNVVRMHAADAPLNLFLKTLKRSAASLLQMLARKKKAEGLMVKILSGFAPQVECELEEMEVEIQARRG